MRNTMNEKDNCFIAKDIDSEIDSIDNICNCG